MEDSLPALSLQINVPVLSLALTVVLMVAVLSLFLAFRRTPSVHFVKRHLCLVARLYDCHSNKKNVFSVSRWTIWTGLKEPLVSKHCCPETVNFPADSEFNGCVFSAVCLLENLVTLSMRSRWGGRFRRMSTLWTRTHSRHQSAPQKAMNDHCFPSSWCT